MEGGAREVQGRCREVEGGARGCRGASIFFGRCFDFFFGGAQIVF